MYNSVPSGAKILILDLCPWLRFLQRVWNTKHNKVHFDYNLKRTVVLQSFPHVVSIRPFTIAMCARTTSASNYNQVCHRFPSQFILQHISLQVMALPL